MSVRVVLIAAVAANRVLGRGGGLPWHLPKDLAFFRRTTLEETVVVGRRTLESMGGPLPLRSHLVLSRDPNFRTPPRESFVVLRDFDDALRWSSERELARLFVLGGGEVFRAALPHADELLLTRVLAEVDGDVLFPEWDPDEFERSELERHDADAENEHPIVIERWRRRR